MRRGDAWCCRLPDCRGTRVNTPRFVDHGIELSRQRLLATLGCKPGRKLSRRMEHQVDKAVQEVSERVACRSAYCAYPMRVLPGRVCVDGRVMLRSTRLAQAMGPCERVFVYVVTLGAEVDAYIKEWMERRPDFGVIADAAASAAAESMVDQVEQDIAERLSPAQALSLPFSPGYCDWPVQEQTKIFSLLPEDTAGVRLSSDSMMSPRKSITGVLGAGPVADVTEAGCPCSSCARVDCRHRRRPYTGREHEGNPRERFVRPYRGRATELPLRPAQR